MNAAAPTIPDVLCRSAPQYAGLRLSAEDYLALPNDGFKYELVNGVTLLSPSPTPKHQQVAGEISFQLKRFLKGNPLGNVYPETDVRLAPDLVYRPELVFIRAERVRANWQRIQEAPDLVVEIVSPDSRRYDAETKFKDYERYGVREYWIIDPDEQTMSFFRREADRFVPMTPAVDRLTSLAVPGFVLDLAEVRRSYEPL